ncbi:MAG: bifunctional diguanylate cyclase/phosphodiesterase [Lachnospiraceae bacterium]|nr:bifunctional diguanylate cyclase/phosphodiesterase [Lachnospiraceae bacterium]
MNDLQYQFDLLKAMNKKIVESEHMYKLIVERASLSFIYYSVEKNKYYSMGNFRNLFGFEVNNTGDLERFFSFFDASKESRLREVFFSESYSANEEAIDILDSVGKRWFRVVCSKIYEGEVLTDKVVKIIDITKDMSRSEELLYMAYYDSLTGIYNRNYFITLLDGFISDAKEKGDRVAIITIDIDDFKKVNDGLGMIIGDEFLQQFGSYIKEFQNDRVIVSHLSNDIFGIGIYNPLGDYAVSGYINRIRNRLKEPFKMSTGQEVSVSVSFSVSEYPEAAASALSLINCGDIAMFRAKSLGNDQLVYFDAKMLDDFMSNVSLENKLSDAVMHHRFEVYFQPQYHADSQKLRGMEALLRWKDEEKGFIPPSVFIPIAEKNGAIIPIGNYVLERSIKQYAEWKEKYDLDFTMSINISAVQYKRDDFVENVIELIKRYNVDPQYIELEITESILIDDFEAVTKKLRELRDFGLKISMDDFGTGYSSLSYLMRMPIDTLKIDKSFVDSVLSDNSTRIILDSILDMSQNMGFESIAEGVESENQYNYLFGKGCDVIQGFYLGKPQPAGEITKMLEDGVELQA